MITSGQRTRLQFEWTPALSRSSPRASASSATRVASAGAGSFVAAVLDELDREHRAEAAHVADRLEALLPREHPRADRLADPLRALDETLLLEHVEDGERGGERDGIADVGAADRAVPERSP